MTLAIHTRGGIFWYNELSGMVSIRDILMKVFILLGWLLGYFCICLLATMMLHCVSNRFLWYAYWHTWTDNKLIVIG